jgi:predicted ATPase
MLAGFAQACADNGVCEEGFALVAEGLERAKQDNERSCEADLYRVKGELLMMRDPCDEVAAEKCFRDAIDIAQGQSARLFELRATTSLARLLQKHGKIEEARSLLSEIYNWFTEGFETVDLRRAKALLDELGA